MTNRRRFQPTRPASEETEHYDRVVLRWDYSEEKATRIIECRHGIQWVVQHKMGTRNGSPIWRSRHFCRTRAALEAILPSMASEIVGTLPERFPEAA